MKLLLIAATFTAILAVSTACSCLPITPVEAYKMANWVSHVRILSKKEVNSAGYGQDVIYTVRHINVYKNVKGKRWLPPEIRTPQQTATCGVPFLEPMKEYLVPGFFDNDAQLNINLCSPIVEWQDVPNDIKSKLKAGEFGRKVSR